MLFYYKNSLAATLVSILGSGIIVCGGVIIAEGEIFIGILTLLTGLFITFYCGKRIAKNKAFKDWTKALKEKGLEEHIKSSSEVARKVYDSNPCEKSLKYIENLNPKAAAEIRKSITK